MSAFKVSELLNPAPSSPPRFSEPSKEPSPPSHLLHSPSNNAISPTWSRNSIHAVSTAVTQAYEAADALTALATSGAPSYSQAYAPSNTSYNLPRDQFSPVGTFDHVRRVSNFGTVAPIEPSPSADRTHVPHSPTTLDQYHHGSKSPEEHLRRQSIFSESSSAPKLAPIQSLTGALSETINGQQPARSNAYGQDTSSYAHSTSHQPSVDGDNAALNNIAQSCGPGFVRDTMVTSPIREPSDQDQIASDKAPLETPRQPSPPSHIKTEHSPTPASVNESSASTIWPAMPNGAQQGTPPADDMDPETRKLVEKLKNEHGVRAARGGKSSIDSIPAFEPPPAKKRVAPKGASAAATKKGVAKKPPAKKRKADDYNNAASPGPGLKSNSPTPSTVAAKKKGSKSKDNTPGLGSSPPAVDEGMMMMDDGEEDCVSAGSADDVYCICRKGDDHSWMIACDGGCEDWFHGKCVKIREEDGDLIDRYICPACEKRGAGVTTWKPMCRRDDCRKPARVSKSNASKYCSDACGEMFMAGMVEASNTQADGGGIEADKKRSPKSRRKSNYTDNMRNSVDESDDDDMGPRGGPLRPGEIKALATCANDVGSFRSLGDGVLSPPPTASPDEKFPNGTFESAAIEADPETRLPTSYTLRPSETQRINGIAEEKDMLRKRRQMLKDKEKFVSMTRDQAQHYAEREGIKIKDVCGYDRRLGWDEHEFERWRKSKAGITAFRLETLDPAENDEDGDGVDASAEEPKVDADADGDVRMSDGDNEGKDKEWFCAKKRCERHKGWQRLAIHDVRAAESELANEMRKLDKEEREIRERAMLRWRKELGGKGDEGTVEAVG